MDRSKLQRATNELTAASGEEPGKSPEVPPYKSPKEQKKGFRRTAILTAAVTLGAVALVMLLRSGRSNADASADGAMVRTATVERRDFVRTMRVHGTVEAVEFRSIMAPRLAGQGGGSMIITKVAPPGMMVKRGDLLVEFDRQNQVKTALDRAAEYNDFEEQIKRREAEQAAALAKDQTELKQGENGLATAEVEMRRNEVISKIDAEKNQQNLEEAQARLKQLRETFQLKRTAMAASIRVLEIQRDRARNAMIHAQKNAEKMIIHSPFDGMVVMIPIWKGNSPSDAVEGDQVWPGATFMQVVNPFAMRVRSRINQADVAFLRENQAVNLGLDAYPGMRFPGKVETVAAIGVTSGFSSKVRTFNVAFSVQGADPKLVPDLSAAVDVELEHLANALVVPRDAVYTENGKTYVRVKSAAGFEIREVKVGSSSNAEVIIESGVPEGAIVLRGNPDRLVRAS